MQWSQSSLETNVNQGHLNETWGKTLIDQLVKQGVDYFCIAPGSRSTPLTLAVAENPKANSFIHFDERGAAFHALGYAKASKRPAAVIVTSGTAVGNLMPAVMEASAAQIPLIVLTCDRPPELRDTMANQTTDQIKIFGDYIRYFFDLPIPHQELPENFLSTTIGQAVTRSLFPIQGPIQLNCPFPEPFFSGENTTPLSCLPTNYFVPKQTLENPKKWAQELGKTEKGVLVLGGNANAPEAKDFAEKLQWPILPDILSSQRELGKEKAISHYHHILKSLPELRANVVLHLGDPPVSKILLQWMASAKRLIHVAQHPKRCDPHHSVSDRIICEPSTFCKQLIDLLPQREKNWVAMWKHLSSVAQETCTFPLLSEPGVMQCLEKMAKPNIALFFGNSMPIRDADMFFFPSKPCGPILGNRGLSGIDGNIATVAGIAHHMPVIAVMGDQTVLHDLNSLAQLKKTKHRVKLIIINNGGGGIFSFLDIGKRKDVLDPYFAATHERKFSHAAQMFDLSYALATHPETITQDFDVIEVPTNRGENLALHQEIDQKIKDALCSSFSMVS